MDNTYHRHLDTCAQCRDHPFALCAEGEKALFEAAVVADYEYERNKRSDPMKKTPHPEPVEGPRIVDWEPLGQIEAHELPAPSDKYPAPWTTQDRGNGHVDVFDAEGRYFAHVHCWEESDFQELSRKVAAAGPRP